MPTVNEDLRDLELSHHVGIQRLSTTIVRKILVLLDKADARILKRLQERGATLEGTFTSVRLQYLLRALREINRAAYVKAYILLKDELVELARYEADYQELALQKTLPIDYDVISPPASQLRAAVIAKPFDGVLLRDAVKNLSSGKMRALQQALQTGIITGETTEQIVRRVMGTKARNYKDGVLNIARVAAERMIRTATNHVANASREIMFEENARLISRIMWVATLDTRTCLACAKLDGKTFALGDKKGPRPPRHLNCRCATVPVTKSWRELGVDADELEPGTRASMNGQVPSTETFSTWLKKQSASIQDETLGPTRGALFRRGKLSIDRFVDVRGNQLTLDQLREKESAAFRRAGV